MKRIFLFLLGIWIGVFLPLGGYAIDFSFIDILSQAFTNSFSLVHFAAGGNEYPGALFVTNQASLSIPQELDINGEIVTCSKQIKGFYYNAQRGKRLWPLDEGTRDAFPGYSLLSMDGGFFSTCSTQSGSTLSVDPYDIIGSLEYQRTFFPTSYVVAGGNLQRSNNSYNGPYASSLGLFNNTKPLGFLYDSFGNSGIGFVGGVGSGECYDDLINDFNLSGGVNDHFVLSGIDIVRVSSNASCDGWVVGSGGLENTQWSIDIKGGVSLSNATTDLERQSLVGNIGQQALLFNTDFANASKLLSLARKNAGRLCRGLTPYTSSTLSSTSTDVICVENGISPFVIDLVNNQNDYEGKTIIVSEGDVVLDGSMPYDAGSFDLLIEQGNLLITNATSVGELTLMDSLGFPVQTNAVTRGKYINANVIVNGIVAGTSISSPSTLISLENKVFVHGRLALLSTPLTPSPQRTRQLENLFGSSWIASYGDLINLQTALVWRCLTSGLGNDGFSECDDSLDDHAFASLIVIKQAIESPLLQN